MKRTVVVDAHMLLWFLEDSLKLSSEADAILSDPESRLLLPVIVVAEICWAIRKGKSHVTVAELRQAIESDARLAVIPLDDELVYAADALPADLEMHDRFIVAVTAKALAVDSSTILLTSDAQIRASRLVPTLW